MRRNNLTGKEEMADWSSQDFAKFIYRLSEGYDDKCDWCIYGNTDCENRDSKEPAWKKCSEGIEMFMELGPLDTCPFCGENPEVIHVEYPETFAIKCSKCGVKRTDSISFVEAANKWNDRIRGYEVSEEE